jgi:CRISPR system Cascade subunit CasE
MYLTQLPNVPEDDYQVHQKIRKIFPENQKVLFQRCDEEVFILSNKKPETEGLSVKEIDISSYKNGGLYAFTLRLNPAKRDIKTGKRVAIDPTLTKDWIKKQLCTIGIEANFQYIREGTRRSLRQEKTVSFVSILCFGSLTIKDTNLFQKALTNGVGHGKGFGFGLINIFA